MRDEIRALCEASIYLSMGVMEAFNKEEALYEKAADALGGHCGIVDRLIDVAALHQDWFNDRKVEWEDMTNGVYVYEVIEDELAKWFVSFFKEHDDFPDDKNLYEFLDARLKEGKMKNGKVYFGPAPGSRVIEV